ncbi:MAG: SDR family oxidoreductase, partial [Polyangiales bacterium]
MSSANRVFVTGGTGLIGRALVERLLRRGVNVTLMLRTGAVERRKQELEALDRAAGGLNGSLSRVTGDLTAADLGLSEDGLAALSQAAQCFHVAALYDIEADSDALETSNVEGTRQLISALRKAGF